MLVPVLSTEQALTVAASSPPTKGRHLHTTLIVSRPLPPMVPEGDDASLPASLNSLPEPPKLPKMGDRAADRKLEDDDDAFMAFELIRRCILVRELLPALGVMQPDACNDRIFVEAGSGSGPVFGDEGPEKACSKLWSDPNGHSAVHLHIRRVITPRVSTHWQSNLLSYSA